MTKQYEVTVKILVTVPDDNSLGMNADQWAGKIAGDWANMALTYRNIGADDVVSIDVEEAQND